MKLSTRLILLVLGCLLPILAAQVYSQVNLHHARQAQVSALVLRQAELANANLGTVVDAVTQLWTTVVQFPEVPAAGPRCDARLTSLQRDLPQYRFLALYRVDGTLLCGSAAAPGVSIDGHPQWLADLATTSGVQVGPLVSTETPGSAFLPVGIHVPGVATEPDPRVLVAALDAGWLARRLEAARSDDSGPLTHATLIVADHDGAVVAWLNDGKDAGGQSLPVWARPFVNRQTRGVATVTDPQGRAYIAAYVPATGAARGLGVIETVALSKVTADIDRATYQDLAVIAGPR
jgi:hypothetical protein